MEDFEKSQLDNIRKAGAARDSSFLEEAQRQMHTSSKQVGEAVIGGKKLIETDIYKLHFPIFTKIYAQLQPATFSKIIEILLSSIGPADPNNPPELTLQGLLGAFSKNIDENINNQLVDSTFLSNKETTRILKGLIDYQSVSNQNVNNQDPMAKKAIAMDLYESAFELYLKILKDAYSKLTGANPKAVERGEKNKEMYDFYKANYPELMVSVDNVLRKDSAHLTYDEREKYTAEELMKKEQ